MDNSLERKLAQERAARQRAEQLLERKTRQAKRANEELRKVRSELTKQGQARTEALTRAVRDLKREIGRRKAIEQALRSSRDSALELADLKSQFLARMSHEIRTPLNAVIGMTGLVLESQLDAEQRRQLDTVRSSGRLLLRLINDILDLARIDANKLELEFSEFSLQALLEQCLSLVMLEAEQKGVSFQVSRQHGMADRVIVDGGRVQQLLLNLLSNAVKYSDGGTVTVGTRLEQCDPEISVPDDLRSSLASTGLAPYRLSIVVTDQGRGIRQDDLPRLFEPFTQFQGATQGSSGLGLTICERICKLMGGDISVDSTFGKGSTFTASVTCGVKQADVDLSAGALIETTMQDRIEATARTGAWLLSGRMSQGQIEAHSQLAVEKPLSILLADDYEVNRMVQNAQLEQLGYSADVVTNGEEALRALHARPYDVVLMDILMPVLDGVEATRRIRQRKDGPQPFIVALTASALPEDRERFASAGFDSYLAKPVELADLAAVLSEAYGSPGKNDLKAEDDFVELTPVDLDLDDLYRRLGPATDGLLARVIPVFTSLLPSRKEALRSALRDADADTLTRLCHGLKGSSQSIGATKLAAACERHEKRAAGGRLPSTAELEEFLDLADATARALTRKLAELPSPGCSTAA